jgi:hypothetical protein
MPDLSRPRQINGKLYCWDRAHKELVEIVLIPVDLAGCDRQIIAAFVEDGSDLGEDSDAYIRR